MSSYNKLKEKNEKLMSDIFKVLDGDFDTCLYYRTLKTLESATYFGTLKLKEKTVLSGVYHQIQRGS